MPVKTEIQSVVDYYFIKTLPKVVHNFLDIDPRNPRKNRFVDFDELYKMVFSRVSKDQYQESYGRVLVRS